MKHRVRLLTALALVSSMAVTSSKVEARTALVEHLPDLQTLKPSELRIDTSSGRKLLRFSNTVANLGDGRLELRPQNPAVLALLLGNSGTSRVYQGIYTHDATGRWIKVRERLAGTSQFHTAHNHWHFEKFARYDLRAVGSDGSPGQSLNRVSEKTTFCVIDTDRVSSTIEHAEAQRYLLCGREDTTGLSVGWADTYGSHLDGQWVDVSGLADGVYWLVSTADYAGNILETNEANNEAAVKIQISGNVVSVLS